MIHSRPQTLRNHLQPDTPAQKWPDTGRKHLQSDSSGPKSHRNGPEPSPSPTLRPRNGLTRAGNTSSQTPQALKWPKTECRGAHLACVHGKGARAAVSCTHRQRNRVELPLIALGVQQTGFQLAFACTLRLIAGLSCQLEEEIALGLFVRKGRQGHSACVAGKNSPVCLRQRHSACVAGKNSPERLRQRHSVCVAGKNSPVCLRQRHSACVAGKNSPERLRRGHSACVAGKNSPERLRRGTAARTISDGRPGRLKIPRPGRNQRQGRSW